MEGHPYLAKTDNWAVRVAGAILGAFGLGLAALFGRAVYVTVADFQVGEVPPTAHVVILAVIFVVAAMSLHIGYRFVFNRPTANGTLFSPFWWMVLGATLLGLAVVVSILVSQDGGYHFEAYRSSYGVGGLAVWCFIMAYRSFRKGGGAPSNSSPERMRER